MSSMINKVDLIAALRLRYDYYSASTIFEAALAAASLRDQDAYDARELGLWRAALVRVGDRLAAVEERLDSLTGAPAAPAPTATPKPAAPVDEPAAHPKAADAAASAGKPAETKHADPAGKHAETKPADPVTPPGKHAETTAGRPDAKATDPATTKAGDETSTTVKLVGIDVGAGEQVLVCGSFVDWNVERAVAMKRSGDAWLATIPVAPGTKIAFKFLRHAADGKVIWEGGDDRKLAGPRIEATWQPEDAT